MSKRHSPDSLGAGIFLIGLGTLFLLSGRVGFFPWILVIIGLAGLPSALSGSRGWPAWQGLFWLVGLAVLFATGSIWPGILILVGVSMLMGAMAGGAKASKRAAPDIDAEPVTTTALPLAPLSAPVVLPLEDIELDDHGTAPLSSDDLDTLEAELAAAVEGAPSSTAVAPAESDEPLADDLPAADDADAFTEDDTDLSEE